MAHILLRFQDSAVPALDAVEFNHPHLSECRRSFRGKGLSQALCRHTFQWSPAVRAMAQLLILTRTNDLSGGIWPSRSYPALCGGAGTAAASLDYAISKRPGWLLDMFGTNASGDSLARSIFVRWNSERKRGGEVSVAVNPLQLEPAKIEIHLGWHQLDDTDCRALLLRLEQPPAGGTLLQAA